MANNLGLIIIDSLLDSFYHINNSDIKSHILYLKFLLQTVEEGSWFMTSASYTRYAELTRDDIAETAGETTVILPTGAVEQHGPFLPVGVDTLTIDHLAHQVARAAASEIAVTVAPALPFGNSHYHRRYAGALSIRLETYQEVMLDLVDCLAGSGYKRIFILNGHGGNDETVRAVAREGAYRFGVKVAACSYWVPTFQALKEAGALEVGPVAGHAGGFETSLMYVLRPDLIREDRFPPVPSSRPKPADQPMGARLAVHGTTSPMATGPGALAGGYSDSPDRASAAKGRLFLDTLTAELSRMVVAFHGA